MRDFNWLNNLWCVIKEDGRYAGVPCISYEEARELSNQHSGAKIFKLTIDDTPQTKRTKRIYCPCNGFDCPYYQYSNGECGIDDPINECDDFAYFWEEDDDYMCEDEERTAFE